MFFTGKRSAEVQGPLKPFVLRVRDGFLVGLAMDPDKGSPCVACVQGWLEKRGLGSQPGKIEELKIRRDILAELLTENNPHVLYEVNHDGTVNRLNSTVFPLPGCPCAKGNFSAPQEADATANYSFSPITHIKCFRYVTPNGHLWLTNASGVTPLEKQQISVYGTGTTKGASRRQAIDTWLKQAALRDLTVRVRHEETIPVEILQTGNGDLLSCQRRSGTVWESVGAGADYHEATLDALYSLTRQKTLQGYSNSQKSPMLVVGANNWIRSRVPYFLLQEYDIHLLFYPNASPCWVVGMAAFSRIKSDAKPFFSFASDADITKALETSIEKLLEWARPEVTEEATMPTADAIFSDKGFRLNMWWTHWIYRCSKIALKDILHLEAYPRSVDFWRDYVRDGQAAITMVPLNHPDLPVGLRTLVKLTQAKEETTARRVLGIGTLSPYQDAVL